MSQRRFISLNAIKEMLQIYGHVVILIIYQDDEQSAIG